MLGKTQFAGMLESPNPLDTQKKTKKIRETLLFRKLLFAYFPTIYH